MYDESAFRDSVSIMSDLSYCKFACLSASISTANHDFVMSNMGGSA